MGTPRFSNRGLRQQTPSVPAGPPRCTGPAPFASFTGNRSAPVLTRRFGQTAGR
jgi:hypothetical protein